MKKEDKLSLVQDLVGTLNQYNHIYFTNTSAMDAVSDNLFRRRCFEQGIKVLVVKNALLRKAMAQVGDKQWAEVDATLVGQTALLFTDTANLPAKLIQTFGVEFKKAPVLKAAYLDGMVYTGADKLGALASLKSKEELLADVLALLQAPIRNVLSALQESKKEQAVAAE